MIVNKFTIQNKFGWWDSAGRNLFWRFPIMSFINIKNKSKLNNNYLFIKKEINLDKTLFTEKDMDKIKKSLINKIYIPINDDNPLKISKIIINDLIGILSHNGILKRKLKGECPTVEFVDEIVFGINDNPQIYKDILLKFLNEDLRLSTYSPIRPLESYSD